MAALMACDEEALIVHHTRLPEDERKGIHFGTVVLIYGNDGWDVICDYHPALEVVLAGANALAAALGEAL